MIKPKTKRLVQTFVDMVSVSSESGDESAFAEYIIKQANKLGLISRQDSHGNVYIEFKGNSNAIMFNTHMDTVTPGKNIQPQVSEEYISSDGTTILGADSKAGIAAMFETISLLQENKIDHKTLSITLTRNEETGIPTADKITSDIRLCVVPDRGKPVGEIITEAPYAQVFEVTIYGKTAYAPTNYKDGKNAIMAANHLIYLLPWGDIDDQTTTNVGLISGGTMTSMIADKCIFKGSCYSFNKVSFETFLKDLQTAAAKVDKKFGTKTNLQMLEYFGGFKIDINDPLVKLVDRSMRLANIEPDYKIYKAVTNANLLNQQGIKSVLISTGVENQHTVQEKIKISELENITSILLNIVSNN